MSTAGRGSGTESGGEQEEKDSWRHLFHSPRLSFLDRVNIGQANAGSPGPSLTTTLELKGDQYQGEHNLLSAAPHSLG